MKIRVGIEGITFDSSHYTKGITDKCMNIHGHTFKLAVEVEGEVDPKTGMVIDFLILKNIISEVVSEYDHKFIIPKKDIDKIKVEGPFRYKVKAIEYPEATTEYIAMDIAKKLFDKINLPVTVKLYEGTRNYVVISYNGKD